MFRFPIIPHMRQETARKLVTKGLMEGWTSLPEAPPDSIVRRASAGLRTGPLG